jgi:mannose-6-phosphate isomerase-like protein (cupin superfamily)
VALPAARPIREIEALDRARLDAEIRPAREPVVVRGLAFDWPAVQAGRSSAEAAIAYLKRFTRSEPVTAIVGPPEIEGHFFYAPDLKALNFQRGQSPIDPFLDRLLRDQATERPFAIAMQSILVPEMLPGFAAENAMPLVDADVPPRLWIGNRIRVATHYDLMENIGVVMAGRRRFTLFPPDQIANLYPGPFELTPAGTPVSLVDPGDPDLDRYPRFAEAWDHAVTALLEPGDAIYIPYHWWHAVDSLDPVSAFVNYWWNPAPRHLGAPYDALMQGFLALRGLPDDQRQVWRTLFDHYVFGSNGDAGAHLPDDVKGVLGPITPDKAGRIKATLMQALARK